MSSAHERSPPPPTPHPNPNPVVHRSHRSPRLSRPPCGTVPRPPPRRARRPPVVPATSAVRLRRVGSPGRGRCGLRRPPPSECPTALSADALAAFLGLRTGGVLPSRRGTVARGKARALLPPCRLVLVNPAPGTPDSEACVSPLLPTPLKTVSIAASRPSDCRGPAWSDAVARSARGAVVAEGAAPPGRGGDHRPGGRRVGSSQGAVGG